MNIETKKDIYGRDFNFVRLGLVKGRNEFYHQGFKQCQNPLYVVKDDEHWHYNGLMKVWVQDSRCFA